jgi:hypothetical protein
VTSPDRINVAGQLDVICFDKTGTLTEQGLELMGVVPLAGGAFQAMQKQVAALPEVIVELLATCHGLAVMGEQLVGDPLDQKLFAATGWELHDEHAAAAAAAAAVAAHAGEDDEEQHASTAWVCPTGQPGKAFKIKRRCGAYPRGLLPCAAAPLPPLLLSASCTRLCAAVPASVPQQPSQAAAAAAPAPPPPSAAAPLAPTPAGLSSAPR